MSAALLLPYPPPFAPLTASLCIHLPFSQSAGNHNAMQGRYLVGARAAVGRWRLGAARSVHNRECKVISEELTSYTVSSLSRGVHVMS